MSFACYGVRRVRQALRHEGRGQSRGHVTQLLRLAGLRGVTRQKSICTTYVNPVDRLSPDSVQRRWARWRPTGWGSRALPMSPVARARFTSEGVVAHRAANNQDENTGLVFVREQADLV